MTERRTGKSSIAAAMDDYLQSGCQQDLEEVVIAGQKLVFHFASLFSGGRPSEDMLQTGREGLMKAVLNFNPEAGASFVTYAGHCILGEIRHFLRKENSYYHPGCIADLQSQVETLVEESLKTTGEIPSTSIIAETLNVKREAVVQVMRAGLVPLEELDLGQVRSARYESFRLPVEDRLMVQQALRKLNQLQRRVVYSLFYRDMTQVEVAEEMGISQRKVSRVLHRSLAAMAKTILGNGH